MKICHIGNINTIHFQNIINTLQEQGHENYLLSLNTPVSKVREGTLYPGVRWYFVGPLTQGSLFSGSFWRSRYKSAQKVKNLIQQLKPDLVHAYYLTDAGLLSAFAKYHPYVVLAIGSDVLIDYQHNFLKKQAINFSLNNADLILCYSRQIEQVLNHQPRLLSKVKYFPNGVNLARFKKAPPDETLLKKLNLEPQHKIVISLRNFEPIYNIECLIHAVPYVIEKIPTARFLLLGEGDSKESLISLAQSLNVADYVHFLTPVPNSELPRYINLASVYVSTALSDGMSFALLEAMACEMPVVVTDIPANQVIVKHARNGFLFPKNDSNALVGYLIKLLSDQALCATMGRYNQKIVADEYNFTDFMKQLSQAFQQVCNGEFKC